MKKKILFELRVATNIFKFSFIFPKRKKFRDSLIENGLKLLFDDFINFEKFNVDFIFTDNTVSKKNDINSEILKLLPKKTIIQTIKKNYYGKKNKGAGDIDLWNHNRNLIKEYDYFFHYQPRIQIFNKSFIKEFLHNPCNYFSLDQTNVQFKTAYFGIETKKLIDFIDSTNLDKMVKNRISIEKLFYDYFTDKSHKIFDGKFAFRYDDHTSRFELY